METPRKIVVLGTDFSHCSRSARVVAVEYAQRLGASLHIVHVSGWLHGGDETALLRAEAEHAAVPVVTCVVFGSSAGELARYAHECGAVLLVVGTHGRTGVSHMLLGSTAERLLRLAHCPVLVVPPLEEHEAKAEPAALADSPCLVCATPVEELICERCRGRIRGEAIVMQQEEARKARV